MRQHSELEGLPPLLTFAQACHLLRVRRRELLSAVVRGTVPARPRAGRLLIPTAELLEQFGVAAHNTEDVDDHDG